jgi:hypothetical protein
MSDKTTVLEEPFNTETEEGTSYDLLPPGKYAAEIDDASVVTTKNGEGQLVKLRWRIVEGDCENRVVFQQILIQHTSADAQKFGRQRFKDVASACDIKDPITDLEVLKYKKCSIKVAVEKDKDGVYDDKNIIKGVYPFVANWNGDARAASQKVASTEAESGRITTSLSMIRSPFNRELSWRA